MDSLPHILVNREKTIVFPTFGPRVIAGVIFLLVSAVGILLTAMGIFLRGSPGAKGLGTLLIVEGILIAIATFATGLLTITRRWTVFLDDEKVRFVRTSCFGRRVRTESWSDFRGFWVHKQDVPTRRTLSTAASFAALLLVVAAGGGHVPVFHTMGTMWTIQLAHKRSRFRTLGLAATSERALMDDLAEALHQRFSIPILHDKSHDTKVG